jgi:hypothetical protein
LNPVWTAARVTFQASGPTIISQVSRITRDRLCEGDIDMPKIRFSIPGPKGQGVRLDVTFIYEWTEASDQNSDQAAQQWVQSTLRSITLPRSVSISLTPCQQCGQPTKPIYHRVTGMWLCPSCLHSIGPDNY